MKKAVFLSIGFGLAVTVAQSDSQFAAAEKARDKADVPKLQEWVENARQAATGQNTASVQQWIALLDFYLCEASYVQGKNELIKGAAEEGFTAAEKAATLDPSSSEAHRLLGDLAVILIPYSAKGAVTYGKRSAVEADKALELDPKNTKALVSRGLAYFYTPAAAGGDKQKGFELLKKAAELDPTFDAPHTFLAQMYLSTGQKQDAVREIKEALRLNPDRRTAQMAYKTVMAATGDTGK
ncbi:MAG TPA: tetratricopeptide repeat protein [Bryobacteraceae bacterium]|nr:tetratricopeptide repeat protein [Bryobacteraceae bacterium]